MALRAYLQVDVFTANPLKGNPLAVVLDGSGLDTETMQAFARWTNLSETTFVLPPTAPAASYRVRIFTPLSELPFAGHPSVGTAWALLDAGLVKAVDGHLIQECAAGLLDIEVRGDAGDRLVGVQAPRATRSALTPESIEALPIALGAHSPLVGARPVLSNVGARWVLAELPHRAAVRSLVPDMERIAQLSHAAHGDGVAVFSFEPGQPVPLELRAFCPGAGVPEDPVTGSAHAAVGDWLWSQGRLAAVGGTYQASQGAAVGRDGQVQVSSSPDGRIRVGGRCCALIRGAVEL